MKNKFSNGTQGVFGILTVIVAVIFFIGLVLGIFNLFKKDQEGVYDGAELTALAANLENQRDMYAVLREGVKSDIDRLNDIVDIDLNGLYSLRNKANLDYMSLLGVVVPSMSVFFGLTSSEISSMRSSFGGSNYFFDMFAGNVDSSDYTFALSAVSLYDLADGEEIYNYYNSLYIVDRSSTWVNGEGETIYAVDLLYDFYSYGIVVYEAMLDAFDSYDDYIAELELRQAEYTRLNAEYQFLNAWFNYGGLIYYSELLSADNSYLAELDAIIYAIDLELVRLTPFLPKE
jgi:hypothetical protein